MSGRSGRHNDDRWVVGIFVGSGFFGNIVFFRYNEFFGGSAGQEG